ncbi:HTH-type transcriptional regulator SutR [Defluviimonas aquaemixtae]|uniref:HTH-type transcriptional regulator SutR n=1 Tax=Albidovulum aquaemixtae TaxID=1542388 RepID=A0A2R8B7X2_9RHOB|nr:XRE family transcriptional regulator [Defluviimonas aquaemixtae]SPH18583.1 HTH-type transcriptional regulator SutR [Defluviimonas aquaemixtae]
MLSETLNERLGSYRIGQQIRELRAAKGLGLAQLGKHSGLSAGMLSKIERGQVFPTLPTLMRIAMVFGVGLDHFFTDGEVKPVLAVVRRAERLRLPSPPSGRAAVYFESLDYPVTDRLLQSYLAEFPSHGPATDPHQHKGVETIYIIAGCLGVEIHGTTHRLETGDSMYFEADFEHSYICMGDETCRAVVVVSGEPAEA